MINWVTINRFAELSGYTEKAVRSKITEGVWLQGQIWRKAPDSRILISLRGYDEWAEGQAFAPLATRPSRSTSATVVSAVESGSD
jgi:hypothetical protein